MIATRKFKSEEELKKHIGDNADTYTDLLRSKVGQLESEHLKAYKQGLGGLFLMVSSIVFWYVHPPVFIPLSILLLYLGVKRIINALPVMRRFNRTLNRAIYVLVFELFDIEANYLEESKEVSSKSLDLLPNKLDSIKYLFPKRFYSDTLSLTATEKVKRLLDDSELMAEPRNTLVVDDVFTIKVTDREMVVAELDAKDVQWTGRGSFIKRVFYGLFVSLELPHTLKGKTFISTEVDLPYQEFDLPVQTFKPEVHVTELEWNDFEKLLQVKTTDPVEARYILVPDFMQDLYDWWRDKKRLGDKTLQVRLSFLENRAYLLFPFKRMRIGNAVRRIQADEIREYLELVCIPLMHVLNVMGDIEKRFAK